MMSQDNRLLPLSAVDRSLDRPLTDLAGAKSYGALANESVNLRDYAYILLKRKWLILTLVVVVTSMVTIQMYRQPSIYEASTTIEIEQKRSNILQTGKEIVINTGGSATDPVYWQTQLRLMENPALARQVILTLDLQHNPAFFGGQAQTTIMASLRRLFARAAPPSTATSPVIGSDLPVVTDKDVHDEQLTPEQLAALEPYEDTLAANLTVEPVTGTSLVTLKYRHTDPELAQKIANTLADVFIYNNMERETQGSKESEALLAKKISELQLQIRQGQEKLFNLARAIGQPLTNEPGSDLGGQRLGMLSKQLLEAENDRKNFQAQYEAAAREQNPNNVPEIQENARVQKLRDKLETLTQKRAELLNIYTPEWWEVKKIDGQIKLVQDALSKAPAEIVASMKSKYEAALAKEDMLRQAYNKEYAISSSHSRDQIEASVLKQEVDTNQQYLNTLLQRQRELENQKNGNAPNNITVSNYGRVPRTPIGPPRMRNIFIAFLLALGSGIGLTFLLHYLDDTLKSVDDVERYIHMPTLALIPATRSSEKLRLKGDGSAAPGEEVGSALALIDDVRSPVAESYRHLRTSLLLSSAGQPPKTILVTSSQPSEGKTTTAVNTAVMLAQTGAEVVLIDCDLRRPRVHAHFHIPNTGGVTNYLSGEMNLDSLIHTYDKIPNLKLMTSGPVPPNPAELLGSEEMRKLVSTLSERFTHIIMDSPPAISFTDASILSTIVDGVMLVVHGGRSSRAVVRRARQQLIDVGAHLFGVVLNNVKLEAHDYYYYGGYYSSYYMRDDPVSEGDGAAAGAAGASGTH